MPRQERRKVGYLRAVEAPLWRMDCPVQQDARFWWEAGVLLRFLGDLGAGQMSRAKNGRERPQGRATTSSSKTATKPRAVWLLRCPNRAAPMWMGRPLWRRLWIHL
jgi:hypothetical protein